MGLIIERLDDVAFQVGHHLHTHRGRQLDDSFRTFPWGPDLEITTILYIVGINDSSASVNDEIFAVKGSQH